MEDSNDLERSPKGVPRSWICLNVANWVCRKVAANTFRKQLKTLFRRPDLEVICGFDQGIPDEDNPYLDFVFIQNYRGFPYSELEGQEESLGIIHTDCISEIPDGEFQKILRALRDNSKLGLGGFVEIKKRPFLGVIGRVIFVDKGKACVALNLGGLEHQCVVDSRDLQTLENTRGSGDCEETPIIWQKNINANPFNLLQVVLPEPEPKLTIHRRGKRNTRVVIGSKSYLVPSEQIEILKIQFEEICLDEPESIRTNEQSTELSDNCGGTSSETSCNNAGTGR